MGRSYKQLKKIIEEKNNTVDYLKRECVKKTLRISELKNELEDLKKGKFTIPFTKETKHALFEAEKEIVEPSTNEIPEWNEMISYSSGTPVMANGEKLYAFELGTEPSRFMPNVKFRGNIEAEKILDSCEAINYSIAKKGWIDGWCISYGSEYILALTEDVYFQQTQMKEVSIYEAIPELVPYGMVYDKESDSLIAASYVRSLEKAKKEFEDSLEKETNHALFEAEKEIVEPSASEAPVWDATVDYVSGTAVVFGGKKLYAFEKGVKPSRFMPNVKFRIKSVNKESLLLTKAQRFMNFLSTDSYGKINKGCFDGHIFSEWLEKEVSIYEAAPELVPNEMVYDKHSDSLISCIIHDDISTFLNDDLFKRLGKFVSCCNEVACYSTKKKDELTKQTKTTSICDSCSKKDVCLLFEKIAGKTIKECVYFKENQDD